MDDFDTYLQSTIDILPEEVGDKIHEEFDNLYSRYHDAPNDQNLNHLICMFQEFHCDLSDGGEGFITNAPTLQQLLDGFKYSFSETRKFFKNDDRHFEESDVDVNDVTAFAAATLKDPRVVEMHEMELQLSRNNCCEEHNSLYIANLELFKTAAENCGHWSFEKVDSIFQEVHDTFKELQTKIAQHCADMDIDFYD